MPKTRKTKTQKKQTVVRRKTTKTITTTTKKTNSPTVSGTSKKFKHEDSILVVPGHFIVSDIRKTIILSIIFIAVTIAAYLNQSVIYSLISPYL